MIPKHIYMVGIGGIGMSALAQLFAHQGRALSGSDREESPTITLLSQKGITVTVGHDRCNVPADTELLVYSDAVWSDNAERIRTKEMSIPEMSYFEALGLVAQAARTVAVTGTHGKTTTTGKLAKVLQDAGEQPTAIVGSIVQDFGSNFLAGRDDLFVVEACEYRDHVFRLNPDVLVITNIELDHTDYFPTLEALQDTFRIAAEKVPETGVVVTSPEDPNIAGILKNVRARIVDYRQKAVGEVQLLGEFNRDNARAALAAALAVVPGLSPEAAVKSLSEFKGSWRRFEYKGETPSGALVYDDYAHHPTAMQKTIEAAREKFPSKKIVVAFHPHLYSRTKSLLNEFAEALALSDKAIVAPIYAAREAPDPSVSNQILAALARHEGGNVISLDNFNDIRDVLLEEDKNSLIITMGAGDIYKVAEQIAD